MQKDEQRWLLISDRLWGNKMAIDPRLGYDPAILQKVGPDGKPIPSFSANPNTVRNAPTGDYDKQWAIDDRNATNFGRITRERLAREAEAAARGTARQYSSGDFPNNDPAKNQYPTDYSGVDIDAFNQRALPPTSQEMTAELYDMMRGQAEANNSSTNRYNSDARDILLGDMVPEAGGVRSGGYIDDRYRQGLDNNSAMNDLKIANILNELGIQTDSAQGLYGATTGGATGRRDMIYGQQDAKAGRVGNQLNDYEMMMFNQLGQEEGAAQDYRSLLEEGARGRRDEGRAGINAGYDRAIEAGDRRQTEVEANNRRYGADPYNQMGSETRALLETSRMMSNDFAQTMADIDESIEIDRALGIASEFSTARTDLKQNLWAARSQLENEVATTKDTAALNAFDTIAAANVNLAASLGAANLLSAQNLSAISEATLLQNQQLEQAMSGAKFAANQSFAADKYAADQLFVEKVNEIDVSEAQGRISSAVAKEQKASAKAERTTLFNEKVRNEAPTAEYFGIDPRVWAAMNSDQKQLYFEASLSGEISVEIDGQQILMSADQVLKNKELNQNFATDTAKLAEDARQFNQKESNMQELVEQAAAAGLDIGELIIEHQKLQGDYDVGETNLEPPPFDVFVLEAIQRQDAKGVENFMQQEQEMELRNQQRLADLGFAGATQNPATVADDDGQGSKGYFGLKGPTAWEVLTGLFGAGNAVGNAVPSSINPANLDVGSLYDFIMNRD